MPNLILPRRFTRQPNYAAPLDRTLFPTLTGAWSLSPPRGGLLDLSGLGNNATVTNAVPSVSQFGPCYYFDGTTDYVSMHDTPFSDMFGFTVTVTPTLIDANARAIASKRNSSGTTAGGNEWQLVATSSTTQFLSWVSAGANCLTLNGPVLVAGKTYTITVLQHGDGNDGHLIINGVVTSATQSGAMQNTSSIVQLGVYQGGTGTRYWTGYIGDFVLWNGFMPESVGVNLSRNPWSKYKRSPQVLYFDVGGSGSTGTFTSLLDNFSTSFTGTTTIKGSFASQLGDVVTSLTGTVTVRGTLTSPLEAFVTELNGVIGATSGSITVTLEPATTALAGSSTVEGDILITLDAAESDMDGTTTIIGILANNLQDVTMAFSGFPGAEGFVARLRTLLGCGT